MRKTTPKIDKKHTQTLAGIFLQKFSAVLLFKCRQFNTNLLDNQAMLRQQSMMDAPIAGIETLSGEELVRNFEKHVISTETPPLDEILAPKFKNMAGKQGNNSGGIMQGVLNLLVGPQKPLSRVLMRLAVISQLSPVEHGINASRVLYVEINNYFDPYYVSRFSLSKGLTPAKVHEKIMISRGFNQDQAVEIVANQLPKQVVPRSLVLISGLTNYFDPREKNHFQGMREMVNGLKKCLSRPDVYMVATAPLADGSAIKPRGGTILAHFAGCIIVVSPPKKTKAGSTVTQYSLIQHPLYPQRHLKSWSHAANKRVQSRKNDLSSFRTLEDFF
ncbi:MAG: hypothetical protein ACFFCS_04960 [Candidatus Hodarchaeota archaeon]